MLSQGFNTLGDIYEKNLPIMERTLTNMLLSNDVSGIEKIKSEALSRGMRFIAIDLRGHGQSSKPAFGYDLRTQVKDVRAVLKALKVSEFVLIGFSMGGAVAIQLAASTPTGLIALMLVSAAAPSFRKRNSYPQGLVRKTIGATLAFGLLPPLTTMIEFVTDDHGINPGHYGSLTGHFGVQKNSVDQSAITGEIPNKTIERQDLAQVLGFPERMLTSEETFTEYPKGEERAKALEDFRNLPLFSIDKLRPKPLYSKLVPIDFSRHLTILGTGAAFAIIGKQRVTETVRGSMSDSFGSYFKVTPKDETKFEISDRLKAYGYKSLGDVYLKHAEYIQQSMQKIENSNDIEELNIAKQLLKHVWSETEHVGDLY
ncbi:unnamed protein product [Didymodactylos carnosus]|uniref:AB hydrolase-1 domain-containing protein n=1 Tax=Didymodactylos carnosus TaxID=1234261 RepID=A0A8S2CJS1_9BILA|nr:unnamed protein product [Didymodactylos carnosus]CAF3491803.1 unnamed protein product [Didymodactylos carnosus]